MTFQSEKELEEIALPFFSEMNFKYHRQVPLFNRVIDFVALDNEENVIGIEFKLKNWKRAIYQVKSNINAFDYGYIFIPSIGNMGVVIDEAKNHGIGIFCYDRKADTINTLLKPKKNNLKWLPNIEYLKTYLLGAK